MVKQLGRLVAVLSGNWSEFPDGTYTSTDKGRHGTMEVWLGQGRSWGGGGVRLGGCLWV